MIQLPVTFEEGKAIKSALMTRFMLAEQSIRRVPPEWTAYIDEKFKERDEALNLFKLTHVHLKAEAANLGICTECLGDLPELCKVCGDDPELTANPPIIPPS